MGTDPQILCLKHINSARICGIQHSSLCMEFTVRRIYKRTRNYHFKSAFGARILFNLWELTDTICAAFPKFLPCCSDSFA